MSPETQYEAQDDKWDITCPFGSCKMSVGRLEDENGSFIKYTILIQHYYLGEPIMLIGMSEPVYNTVKRVAVIAVHMEPQLL